MQIYTISPKGFLIAFKYLNWVFHLSGTEPVKFVANETTWFFNRSQWAYEKSFITISLFCSCCIFYLFTVSHLLSIITNAKRQIILDQARPRSARTENFLTDVKTGRNMDTATQTHRACIYTVLRPVVDAVSKTALLNENSQAGSSLTEAPRGF